MPYRRKHYPPIGEARGKKRQVAAMFDAIAPRYDLLNRILSAGIDRHWRRQAVGLIASEQPRRVLDIATGTADLAIEVARRLPVVERVVGVDIADSMLQIGRKKVERLQLSERVVLQQGDAEKLPFSDAQFDAALVAFGVRNFENLDRGLRESYRVLRPGGVLVVLEFSRPRTPVIRTLYRWYAHYMLPRIGAWLSRDEGAYRYLPASVEAFPDGPDFLRRMEQVGFRDLQWKPMTFGIASLYRGRR